MPFSKSRMSFSCSSGLSPALSSCSLASCACSLNSSISAFSSGVEAASKAQDHQPVGFLLLPFHFRLPRSSRSCWSVRTSFSASSVAFWS